MHLAGVLEPPSAYMFDEAAINLSWRSAALTPVEDELCSHRLRKHNIDACLSQDIECVVAGCPVPPKSWRGGYLKCMRCGVLCLLRLAVAPAREYMLPKLGVSLTPL